MSGDEKEATSYLDPSADTHLQNRKIPTMVSVRRMAQHIVKTGNADGPRSELSARSPIS